MGLAKYLQALFDRSHLLVEAAQSAEKSSKVDEIKSIIEKKIGGLPSEKNDIISSFAGIEEVLAKIQLESLESSSTENEEIFSAFANLNKLEFLERFTKREADDLVKTIRTIDTIDRDKDQIKYIRLVNEYTLISENLLKINRILRLNADHTVSESVTITPEVKNKIDTIIRLSQVNVIDGFNKIVKSEENRIADIPNTPEGANRFNNYLELFNLLGLTDILKNSLENKEKKLEKVKNPSTKKKERIIKRLINAVKLAQLPAVSNDMIEINGDFFKLFTRLDQENRAWMDLSLNKYVFGGEAQRLAEFNSAARSNESSAEEDQLTYLAAARSWILSYIKGEVDGILSDKVENNEVSELGTAFIEKQKEIKNYYLSRDFNLSNLGGIQIKPEIKLLLYTKVKLAVSKEDRLKESPLRNVIAGLGQIITGLFSAIPDRGNREVAERAKQRNLAVLNGISSLIKGGVILVGGKQAGRDYDEKVTSVIKGDSKTKIKEDMLALTDSPGFVAVNPEQPGQFMQTPNAIAGGMDTLSLAGPGTKKKKKKSGNVVKSFSAFVKGKEK